MTLLSAILLKANILDGNPVLRFNNLAGRRGEGKTFFTNFAGAMEKISWKPGTMVYPAPAAIVTVGADPSEWNMLTIAWTGTICTDPAMLYISVRPARHSYPMLLRRMEFTLNLTTEAMVRATDWVGVRSGADFDKWTETGLTPLPGEMVASPTIAESPLAIECRVKEVVRLGSHDMFIAEVVNVRADARWIDKSTGAFSLKEAGLLVYAHGAYYALGELIGRFGFSVCKKPRKADRFTQKGASGK